MEDEDERQEEQRKKQAKKLAKKAKDNALTSPGPGEGHQKLSWIWEGAGRDLDTSTGLNEGVYRPFLTWLDLINGNCFSFSASCPVGKIKSLVKALEQGGAADEGRDVQSASIL